MLHYEPKDLGIPDLHKLLLGGVAPRPIALVSTISEDGINNLSPFSFFNVFGANPPMIAFSPSRRGKDASFKDTYNNLVLTKECVVQAVTFSMAEQISLASTGFPPEVDEFAKSGLSPIDSHIVKPKRVKESPFQMECKLIEMKSYGEGGASANMAICEVIKLHISEDIFTNGIIDPQKIDLIGRMSGSYYSRASGDAIFSIEKPVGTNCIGYDQLPDFVRTSKYFSANEIAKLANVKNLPSANSVAEFISSSKESKPDNIELDEETFNGYISSSDHKLMLKAALWFADVNHPKAKQLFNETVRCALTNNDTDHSWKVLLYANELEIQSE